MRLIEWKPEFSLGLPDVDTEHLNMIDLINGIASDFQSQTDIKRIAASLKELRACSKEHFAHEERIMQRRGYTGFDAHRADHRRLLAELNVVIHDCRNGGIKNSDTIPEKLNDWFCIHFKTFDAPLHKLISSYLRL